MRMISKVLELCMEGRRVSRSWFMCVVIHDYGWFVGGRDGGGGWYACGIKPGGRMPGDAGALPECEVIH